MADWFQFHQMHSHTDTLKRLVEATPQKTLPLPYQTGLNRVDCSMDRRTLHSCMASSDQHQFRLRSALKDKRKQQNLYDCQGKRIS
nr:hypothetical protein Iba_chr08aCG7960 [Ipomoea batatas]